MLGKEDKMRRALAIVLAMLMMLALAACGQSSAPAATPTEAPPAETPAAEAPAAEEAAAAVPSGVEDGVLTIAMECAYAPYN
jgi:putative lysine transport system substrate-binding protein